MAQAPAGQLRESSLALSVSLDSLLGSIDNENDASQPNAAYSLRSSGLIIMGEAYGSDEDELKEGEGNCREEEEDERGRRECQTNVNEVRENENYNEEVEEKAEGAQNGQEEGEVGEEAKATGERDHITLPQEEEEQGETEGMEEERESGEREGEEEAKCALDIMLDDLIRAISSTG